MKLMNATKNKILATDIKEAQTFWDKTFGLIDEQNPRSLLFRTRFGLHTFFLKSPIDVLVLDDSYRIAKTKPDLLPWRFFFYPPKYKLVIELPSGTLKKTGTAINDKIFLE